MLNVSEKKSSAVSLDGTAEFRTGKPFSTDSFKTDSLDYIIAHLAVSCS